MWLLGIYLLIAGIFLFVGIFLDLFFGLKLAAAILCLIAGLAILSNPLWSTTVASTWLVILVGFLAMLQGVAGLIVALQGGGWGMGGLVRAGHPLWSFSGDQPPHRGGGADAYLGDCHAHWGWERSFSVQDA